MFNACQYTRGLHRRFFEKHASYGYEKLIDYHEAYHDDNNKQQQK